MENLLKSAGSHHFASLPLGGAEDASQAACTRRTALRFPLKPLASALIAVSALAACGGGGGGGTTTTAGTSGSGTGSSGNTGTTPPTATTPTATTPTGPTPPAAVPAGTQMTMTCADGATYQCSGGTVIRIDNGVALTSSGVHVHGKSTSDLAATNPDKTKAAGLMLTTDGVSEVRVAKTDAGVVSNAALLLSNLGISWDGKTERPPIVETFNPTQGRVVLGANGAIANAALPANTDLGFYDYASKGASATQANYANNRYFPRTGNPPRCATGQTNCLTVETIGVQYQAGDWRTGGSAFDWTVAARVHEDGDVHAGNGLPDANGNPTFLTGSTGPGVPFPGSKGYREFSNWSLQYSNLSAWMSQDTASIAEWTGSDGSNEHNMNRRGLSAFGAVTDPALVPTTGTVTYAGIVYGWYSATASQDPEPFRGTASLTVNFATRTVAIAVQNATTYNTAATPVPVAFTSTVAMGAAGSNVTNYLTGTVDAGALKGGLGGRYFGPVTTTGSGAGPAEIAGTMSLSSTAGAAVVGGFIARKQ